ncbi:MULTISPECIES: hypothetical protein [unclassified Ruminococcus]|uniref:hypothetical protein n=1 Tax=unclassified Ruminococcus TaxID=2608920 RepID=UPI00210B04D8|nr:MULTISPECIES: hypothetical protein [unclassified Ruminococcus]MCQ4021729.1 hypothetical protein [Ruminococcus sp. zg-924]MCQ4114173.1 hypothetical protein [Ruminococcus sp. zg-921]
MDSMFHNNRTIDDRYEDLEHCLDVVHKKDIEAISEMYGLSEKEMRDKYILYLDFEYLYPFYCDLVSAELTLTLNDGSKYTLPAYKVRRPFPNKNWNILSMRNKRKISSRAIPLVFDSFDELNRISHISCVWNFSARGLFEFASIISYDTVFLPKTKESDNIYCIVSYDIPVLYRLRETDGNNADDEKATLMCNYDTVACITNAGEVQTSSADVSDLLRICTRLLQLSETSEAIAELTQNNICAYDFCDAKIDVKPVSESWLLRIYYN